MFQCARKSLLLRMSLLAGLVYAPSAWAQGGPTPGQNVNMVSGTTFPDGDPYLQRQNESSIAVSSRNPCHLLAGANDYRSVDFNFFATGETGDAWLGLFKSSDCGATWQSTLFPGYRLDQTPEGTSSPLKAFNAASDPVVRSGPSGFFGYSGIAFNRGTNNGLVFFGRLVDLNNKENGTAATGAKNSNTDAIRFLGTTVVAKGSATRFLDKPWMAIDVARHGGGCNLQVPLPGGSSVTQTVAVGNIYMAFTAFTYNQMGTLLSSQILFSRSVDCGATWSTPVNLTATDDLFDTDQDSLNQGATIAIDPQTGFVYVAWRRFATSEHTDAIVAAASINGGQGFTPGVPVITLPKFNPSQPPTGPNGPFSFFDEDTTGTRMRMEAFPSLAVANSGKAGIPGQIYLAWSQRGLGPNGEARIMLASSPDCVRWVPPFPIDNGPVLDDAGHSLSSGHQFMPQLTFSGGKLEALYYDLRFEDHTIGTFDAVSTFPLPDSLGRFVLQTRNQCAFSLMGDSLCGGDLPLSRVVTPYLDDAGLTGRRHTLGVSMAQFDPQTNIFGPGAFKTAQVSQFPFGTRGDGTSFLQQLEFNVPNLPLFMGGRAPFLGDYLDIAGPMFALKNGSWVYSTGSLTAPVFHATWTDNRDVKPPLDGDWTKYAPVNLDPSQNSSISVFDGSTSRPACITDTNGKSLQHEGERNQNIYTSEITQGLRVSSPQNSKPLSTTIQRAFVVFVQNFTSSDRSFRLAITSPQPPGGFASFVAGKNNPPSAPTAPSPVTTSIDVTVAAHSGVVRSVFAVSSQTAASITVTATEIAGLGGNPVPGGLSSFVVLNPDPLNPALVNPEGAPAGSDINQVELYEPNLQTPNLQTPNLQTPNLQTPNLQTPNLQTSSITSAVSTPTNLTNVFNLDIATPNLQTPNLQTGSVAAPNLQTPNLQTLGPSSDMTDATYVYGDAGNTAASFHVRLVGNDPGIPLQLIVTNYYVTPVASNCQLALQPAHSVLANAVHTVVQSPANFDPRDTGITDGSTGNVTFAAPPSGIVLVTLRAPVTQDVMRSSVLNQVALVVASHAADTNDATNTPKFAAPLFITTATLPNAVVGGQQYNSGVQLQAIGGTLRSGECSGYFWNWSAAADSGIPPGLTISQRGVISGTPTAAGTYNVLIQVSTCVEEVATRVLTIRVLAPLAITTTSLPTATQGISNGPVTLVASGGTGSYNWTPVTVDGMSLSSSGVLSGTPTATGTFPFTATVSDSGPPAQTVSQLMTLNVVPFTPAPNNGGLLFDNWNNAGVFSGPTTATTFYLPSTTKITQLANYHYYNNGTGPGTISIQNQNGQSFGPFATVGVPGQGGVANAAWVATPNVIVPAGTYTVSDSNSATWSYNATFSTNASGQVACNCGFTRVWGFPVQVSTLTFLTQPTSTPAGAHVFPAVQVQALDSNNQLLPFIAVTIGLGTNPGNGTLSGTLTQTTSQQGIDPSPFGIATFPDLAIDKAGAGYTLIASVNQITATSNQFTVSAAPSAGSRYLIVADGRSSPSSIFRIVPDGSSTALVATLATGRAIAVSIDPTTNTLYSADPINAEVWKVSLWGGAVSSLFAGSPLASPVAVAVDSAGNVYVGDNSTDAVYKITPGTAALFANLPASPHTLQDIRMAFDASGNLVVGSDFVGDVSVSEIDQISPAGVSTPVYNSATMNGGTVIGEIGGLAIDASGNIIVADFANSSIVKIANPGTSNMTATTLITNASLGGNTATTGLTVVDSAAGIYDVTANFANKILSVNTSTNTITTLVSGAPLTYPTDIAMSGFIPSPQPATNVTAAVKSSIPPSVTLNWTASTSAVTSYNIYRKKQGENAFTRIASVSANSPNPTSYTDTAVAFGDSLHYYVTSVDSNNVESVPSNVVDTGLA